MEWSKTPSKLMGTINIKKGFQWYECLWALQYLYQGGRKFFS